MSEHVLTITLTAPDERALGALAATVDTALCAAVATVPGAQLAVACGCDSPSHTAPTPAFHTAGPGDVVRRLPAPVALAACAVLLVVFVPVAVCAAALSAAARALGRWRATRKVARV